MRRLMARFRNSLIVCCLLLQVWPAEARLFTPRMDDAQWLVTSNRFQCSMTQPIPLYGEAVFQRRAGEDARFRLISHHRPLAEGRAQLISDAPVWQDTRPVETIAKVAVKRQQYQVELGPKLATRLMAELETGMVPRFNHLSWYGDNGGLDVALSSVRFRDAFQQYQDCIAGLLPVNFDQIKRTRLHFITDKAFLTAGAKTRLDTIVQYVQADKSVNAFYVDGHTDNMAERLYNLELSKKRAEVVTEYLIGKGVDPERITTRYHGERYPVATNNSAKNRARNRRVTLRLERM